MINLIPSIAVFERNCVRLRQGDYDKMYVYHESPLEVAKKFEDHGIKQVHLIDLEGARQGKAINLDTLQTLKDFTGLEVNWGGGVTSFNDVRRVFTKGASIATIGSAAVTHSENFSDWIITFGREKMVLAIATHGDKVHIRGYQEPTKLTAVDLVREYYDKGILYVKCTDVDKDGTLTGPSYDLYKDLLKTFPQIRLLASGGVRNIDDIKKLEDMGVWGVVFGKAYYENLISLTEIDKFIAGQR